MLFWLPWKTKFLTQRPTNKVSGKLSISLDSSDQSAKILHMSKRTDIHRPSVVNPEDYEFVCFGHQKIEDFGTVAFILEERERFRAHMANTGARFSGHDHGGNCDICGAHCIYDAIFYHEATNVYIRTGLDCAEKMFNLDSDAFRVQCRNAMKNMAGKRKAQATLELEGISLAFDIYAGKVVNVGNEGITICDIVDKLVRYGSISDKAMSYLKALTSRVVRRPEIEAKRAAEHEAAKPLPVTETRMTVTGKVLSVKEAEGFYGIETKILVVSDEGWKVYGNCPSSHRRTIKAGDVVSFDCRVKVSDKDPKFGFFNRPTQMEVK